ncbi:hypothetical protein BD289DRAFT_487186 [Coniella lustricola]|uniref:Zn(2)-C6 fungal-type domain-containing protein n=1 Tax=Coniella lustricola TaxID=2025994 RepID=A0A2T2ZSL3_9PEZI|nr:hypothetical protein BD289DRAFT_487186 [Coniella lustricola]
MPNVGRPSRDCHLCRKRRVKCDLTKPRCVRCGKYGVVCPGYRPAAGLVFHNANMASLGGEAVCSASSSSSSSPLPPALEPTATPASTARRPKRDPSLGLPASPSSTPQRPQYHWLPPLTTPLSESRSAHAVPLLISLYSSRAAPAAPARQRLHRAGPTPTTGPPPPPHQSLPSTSSAQPSAAYYDVLLALLHRRGSEPLQLAVEAQADAYLRNQSNDSFALRPCSESTVAATRSYGKALQALNRALQDPKERIRDGTLIAALLLSSHENITASSTVLRPADSACDSGAPAWFVHARGVASMLSERGVGRFDTSAERLIFWIAMATSSTSYILANQPMPPQSQAWLDAISIHATTAQDKQPLAISRYTYHALVIISRIHTILCALNASASASKTSGTPPTPRLPRRTTLDLAAVWELLDGARELDAALHEALTKDLQEEEQPHPFSSSEIQLHYWAVGKTAVIKLHHHLVLLINAVDDDAAESNGEAGDSKDAKDSNNDKSEDGEHDNATQPRGLQSLWNQRAASLRAIRSCGDAILHVTSELFRAMPDGKTLVPVVATSSTDMEGCHNDNNKHTARQPIAVCWAHTIRLLASISLVAQLPSMAADQRLAAAEAMQVLATRFRIRQAAMQRHQLPMLANYTAQREDTVAGMM